MPAKSGIGGPCLGGTQGRGAGGVSVGSVGRRFIPGALHQQIQDIDILIHSPPEIVTLAVDGQQHFIHVLFAVWPGTPATELIGIRLPKLAAPLPNRFISHRDVACKQEVFDIATAEAEPEIQPDRMADNLRREATILVRVGWRCCFHAASMPHRAEPV